MFTTSLPWLLPYLIFFAIALVMPGRRSLVGLAVLAGVPLILMSIEIGREFSHAHGGTILGVVMVGTIIFSATTGLASGIVTRIVTLWLRGTKRRWIMKTVVILFGFTLIPALSATSIWWTQWDNRLPSEECLGSRHLVEIGGTTFSLPISPFFTLWLGGDKIVFLSFNSTVRSFCGLGVPHNVPVHAIDLTISQRQNAGTDAPLMVNFCHSQHNQWAQYLCRSPAELAASPVANAYPLEAHIYSPDDFVDKRLIPSSAGSRSNFVDARDAAVENNIALTVTKAGIFDRYSNGYWVSHDGSWANEAGEPFTFYCFDTPPEGAIYCETNYRLKAGPRITYGFRTPLDDLEATARTVDRNVHAMLSDLAVEHR